MPTSAWIVLAWLTLNAGLMVYAIDRPRARRGLGETMLGLAELAFIAYLVVGLAS